MDKPRWRHGLDHDGRVDGNNAAQLILYCKETMGKPTCAYFFRPRQIILILKFAANMFDYRQFWQQKLCTQRIDHKSIVIRHNIDRAATNIWLIWMGYLLPIPPRKTPNARPPKCPTT
jgi:hypothetical protein